MRALYYEILTPLWALRYEISD